MGSRTIQATELSLQFNIQITASEKFRAMFDEKTVDLDEKSEDDE